MVTGASGAATVLGVVVAALVVVITIGSEVAGGGQPMAVPATWAPVQDSPIVTAITPPRFTVAWGPAAGGSLLGCSAGGRVTTTGSPMLASPGPLVRGSGAPTRGSRPARGGGRGRGGGRRCGRAARRGRRGDRVEEPVAVQDEIGEAVGAQGALPERGLCDRLPALVVAAASTASGEDGRRDDPKGDGGGHSARPDPLGPGGDGTSPGKEQVQRACVANDGRGPAGARTSREEDGQGQRARTQHGHQVIERSHSVAACSAPIQVAAHAGGVGGAEAVGHVLAEAVGRAPAVGAGLVGEAGVEHVLLEAEPGAVEKLHRSW